MAISTFDQIRPGVYSAPSVEAGTDLLKQYDMQARVDAAVSRRKYFYLLATAAVLVGGVLTGGIIYLAFPLYAALISGGVTLLATVSTFYGARNVHIPAQRVDECALRTFRLSSCRTGGKTNLRSEQEVEADVKRSLRNPDFNIQVHLKGEVHTFTSDGNFEALRQKINDHFGNCNKDKKQAQRRTFKLLDRLHEKAREKVEKKLGSQLRSFAVSNGLVEKENTTIFSKSQTQVELFLVDGQEKVRTFSVYKLSKDQETPGFDSSLYLPILIEEDYHARTQKVVYQPEELYIMPAQEITAQHLFSETMSGDLKRAILSEMPEDQVQRALESAKSILGRDIGRATMIINELEYKFEDESKRKSPERSDECVQEVVENLRERGYSDRDLILCLSCVHQGIMKTSRAFFVEFGHFPPQDPETGGLKYALDLSLPAVKKVSEELKRISSGTSRVYHATFEGPQSKRNFVDYSHSCYLQDRQKYEVIHLEIQGRYHLTDGIEKARARITERARYGAHD